MFGFGDKRPEAVEQTYLYLRSILAGIGEDEGKVVPSAALGDPYVAGFLQVLTVHAVATVYRMRMPNTDEITAIMAEALERVAPGYGAAARSGLAAFNDPAHPLHDTYLRGRHDGSEHVRTLFTHDEIARNQHHRALRAFIGQHYL